jgi:hypothetical protein
MLEKEGSLGESYYRTPLPQWVAGLPGRGFTWENAARGVNADPALRRLFT